jgi:hypothetical protein
MKWIINLLFMPTTGRTIRISPDHLPGLKAPTRAPFRPAPPKPKEPKGSSIEDHYRNFKASDASKAKPVKRDRGMGF